MLQVSGIDEAPEVHAPFRHHFGPIHAKGVIKVMVPEVRKEIRRISAGGYPMRHRVNQDCRIVDAFHQSAIGHFYQRIRPVLDRCLKVHDRPFEAAAAG